MLPPANVMSFVLLLFLQVFISVTLIKNNEKSTLEAIMLAWPLLILVSFTTLLLRYLSLFPAIAAFIQRGIPSRSLTDDLGLSNNLNIV